MKKTNKSYFKRLRVTRNGKVIARVKGQNHFNAKASGGKRRAKRAAVSLALSKRVRNHFLSIG